MKTSDNTKAITLYHGSSTVIMMPEFGKGEEANDYGRGFYMTQYPDLAAEWACPYENRDGIREGLAMHVYDNDAAVDLMDFQGYMFSLLPTVLPDADLESFVTHWMSSNTRRAIDYGSPKFINKSGSELLSWYLNQEIENEYPKGSSDYKPHVLHWVGVIYQLYAYKEKVASSDLVKVLPPNVLYSMYCPWHELSDLGAVKRIKKYIDSSPATSAAEMF